MIRFVREYWVWILSCALLGGTAAVALSFASPRVYRAETLLAPTNGSDEAGGSLGSLVGRYSSLANAVGITVPSETGMVQIAIARLQSRSFIEPFILEENIMPIFYPEDQQAQNAADQLGAKRHTLQDAYRRFVRSVLLVKHDKSSNLVTIRVDWQDRELAARWANKLVARINTVMRADAIEETDRNLEYLRVELAKADYVSLKDSISSLMEGQINKRMLALTQLDYAFRVLDPAQAPDYNKKIAPRRSIYLVVGFALGSFVGVLLALWRRTRQRGLDVLPYT